MKFISIGAIFQVIFEGVGGFRVRIIETNLDQDEIRHIMSMIEFENCTGF